MRVVYNKSYQIELVHFAHLFRVFVNTSQSLASKFKSVTGNFSSPILSFRIGGKTL